MLRKVRADRRGSALWDGTIVHGIDQDEFQNANLIYNVATGTKTDGTKSAYHSVNWSRGATYTMGATNFINHTWVANSVIGFNFSPHYYCMEDLAAVPDTTPTPFKFEYKIFQDTGVPVSSATYIVKGITAGLVPLVMTDFNGGAGSPTYSINGGAATPAGTPGFVSQGDSVVMSLTSPASLNSSYKVTLKIGDADAVPFRVWTKGVSSGTVVKRIFVSNDYFPYALGGMAGADSICQTEATTAGRGGTWKALLSGEATDENSWAINRIGYQWTELWTMDASGNPYQRVLSAPNIWNNSMLESLPNRDELGTLISTYLTTTTNTDSYGFGKVSGNSTCNVWTVSGGSGVPLGQTSGSLSNSLWIDSNATGNCDVKYRLYCIEQ
jgi:hypothetical protein